MPFRPREESVKAYAVFLAACLIDKSCGRRTMVIPLYFCRGAFPRCHS
jgi:hypothetical protein